MADLIRNKHDEDALDAAAANALVCAYGNDPRFAGAAESLAKATAQQQLASAEAEGQIILRAVQNALRRLRAAAGQQTLVLVSSGFVVPGHEQEFGELIDQALHSDIVINVLDARGLDGVDSFAQSTTSTLQYRRESAGASEEIMATLANSTGGTLFQNSNDLTAGFSRVTEPPEYYYLLGFSPRDQELDGRFHKPVGDIEGWREVNVTGAEGLLCSETVVC
jgi:VWFA-related protein